MKLIDGTLFADLLAEYPIRTLRLSKKFRDMVERIPLVVEQSQEFKFGTCGNEDVWERVRFEPVELCPALDWEILHDVVIFQLGLPIHQSRWDGGPVEVIPHTEMDWHKDPDRPTLYYPMLLPEGETQTFEIYSDGEGILYRTELGNYDAVLFDSLLHHRLLHPAVPHWGVSCGVKYNKVDADYFEGGGEVAQEFLGLTDEEFVRLFDV